jgi:hypothetical protein
MNCGIIFLIEYGYFLARKFLVLTSPACNAMRSIAGRTVSQASIRKIIPQFTVMEVKGEL